MIRNKWGEGLLHNVSFAKMQLHTRTHRYTHKHILIHSHNSDLWVILALPHPTTATTSHSLTSESQRDAAESCSLNAVPPLPTQPNSPLSGHLATTSLGPSLMDDLSFLIIPIFCSLVIVIHKMKRHLLHEIHHRCEQNRKYTRRCEYFECIHCLRTWWDTFVTKEIIALQDNQPSTLSLTSISNRLSWSSERTLANCQHGQKTAPPISVNVWRSVVSKWPFSSQERDWNVSCQQLSALMIKYPWSCGCSVDGSFIPWIKHCVDVLWVLVCIVDSSLTSTFWS